MLKKIVKNKKITIAISIFVLLSLTVTGTYAWFISYSNNKVDVDSITVSAGNVLELSLDKGDDKKYTNIIVYDFSSLNLVDITGDGRNFLRPVLKQDPTKLDSDGKFIVTVANPDSDASWTAPISTNACEDDDYSTAQYISMEIYFRANVEMDVYLTNSSYVSPANPSGNYSLYAASETNFSCDWIAATTRVSFIDQTGDNDTLRYIWEPNSNVELYYDIDKASSNNGYKLKTNGAAEPDECYYYKDTNNNYLTHYFKDDTTNPIIKTIQTTTDAIKGDEKALCRLVKNDDTGKYEGKLIVNLWVEGTDREAKRALAGGNIKMSLVFGAFDISK